MCSGSKPSSPTSISELGSLFSFVVFAFFAFVFSVLLSGSVHAAAISSSLHILPVQFLSYSSSPGFHLEELQVVILRRNMDLAIVIMDNNTAGMIYHG